MHIPTLPLCLAATGAFFSMLAVSNAALDPSVLTSIPTCAQGPLISGIANSGCSITDMDCICGNSALISTLQNAIKSDCNTDDQAKTIQLTAQICPNLAGSGSTSAMPSSAAMASSMASSMSSSSEAAEATAPTSATSIVADTAATTASSYVMGTGTSTISANLTATTGTYNVPSVIPSTGDAATFASGFGLEKMVLGVGALGLFFIRL